MKCTLPNRPNAYVKNHQMAQSDSSQCFIVSQKFNVIQKSTANFNILGEKLDQQISTIISKFNDKNTW